MAKQPDSDSFLDMFSRFGRDLKLPNVDVQAILDHHRKNLEALEKSARASAAAGSARRAGNASAANKDRRVIERGSASSVAWVRPAAVVQIPWRAAIVLPSALRDRFFNVKPEAVHAAHEICDAEPTY